MSGDTSTLVKVFRDIFITPYQYSDFDESEDEPPLPKATLNATAAAEEAISDARPAIISVTVSLEQIAESGKDEVEEVKEVKEVGKDYDKAARAPGLAHRRTLERSSGNEKNEDVKANIQKQPARDFESELIRSSVHNILQKHILRAVGSGLAATGASIGRCSQKDLTQFHPFPRLPVELRFKIWEMATRQPRIIAIQKVSKLDIFGNPCFSPLFDQESTLIPKFSSGLYPKSRTPALLHVNREARKECRQYFERRCLRGCGWECGCHSTYYFNLQFDIHMVSFCGNYHLGRSGWDFIKSSQRAFPRLAVILSSLPPAPEQPNSRARNLLLDLHGLSVGHGSKRERFLYPKGLREVFFVVESRLSATNVSEIGYSTRFRPASFDGLTKDVVDFKAELEKLTEDIANDRTVDVPLLRDREDYAWVGDDKPTFSFVSLAPVLSCNKFYDFVLASDLQVRNLADVDPEVWRLLVDATRCEIQLPHPSKYEWCFTRNWHQRLRSRGISVQGGNPRSPGDLDTNSI
ncbi:hypothetical protein DL98DRAFT_535495 [Cadophora sp. DSE1049]|nr:hypothetical protein DL98DRAFT_535495 [Cadophora sp. DSE1049]